MLDIRTSASPPVYQMCRIAAHPFCSEVDHNASCKSYPPLRPVVNIRASVTSQARYLISSTGFVRVRYTRTTPTQNMYTQQGGANVLKRLPSTHPRSFPVVGAFPVGPAATQHKHIAYKISAGHQPVKQGQEAEHGVVIRQGTVGRTSRR